jgi:ABC-2 type transport system ATP-binding protein
LDGISLEVPKGEVFALLGINGAGKTTLVSILCGLIKKDSGEVTWDGVSLEQARADGLTCSLCPQEFAFYPTLTVGENINFFSQISKFDEPKCAQMREFAITFAKLENHLHARAEHLSGGLKRRLNLALSLLNDPQILFLDEPTVGIDPHTREFILSQIMALRGRTIIYTSHHMNEIDRLAKNGALIDKGRILAHFDSGELESVGAEALFMRLSSKELE